MALKFSQTFHLMPTPTNSFVVTNGKPREGPGRCMQMHAAGHGARTGLVHADKEAIAEFIFAEPSGHCV